MRLLHQYVQSVGLYIVVTYTGIVGYIDHGL